MNKLKFTWKIWLLIIFLILSFLSIFGMPPTYFKKGVLITSVETNSTAFDQGLRKGQIITDIDYNKINSLEDFTKEIHNKNFDSNTSIKTIITTEKSEVILYSNSYPEITVSEIPKTRIKTGLDISGGARALIKAENKTLSADEVNDLVAITRNRLNEFGLTDIKVVPVSDLTGNHYMLVEIAGATPKDLKELLSKQGKFEAKVGNDTIFIGGQRDIASVCRSNAQCSRIENPRQTENGYFSRFIFEVTLSGDAAQKHADITKNISLDPTNPEYLSKKLDLYLDDQLVDSLFVGKDLKGRVTTQIQISGSGQGATSNEAVLAAQESMKKLQTILITGSLPYKLEIVKLDTVSPVFGKDFTNLILLAGLVAILSVSIVVFIRYRKIKTSLLILITSLSEIIIILGVASLIKWDLDLPSIAGILATIGTGIDQQIIVFDESRQTQFLNLSQRIKRAFAIILGAYFTVLVSLLPLYWAGAGLFKGFAFTSIIGITVGVLITRPAFTDMVKGSGEE